MAMQIRIRSRPLIRTPPQSSRVNVQARQLQHGRVELTVGDIVDQDTDAIVNAANSTLLGGGGVDGAIHRAAGGELLELCRALPADNQGRRCLTGDVKATAATGALKCKHVIHAVGPVYDTRYAQQASENLTRVHQRALATAAQLGCHSLAFPAISTGAYRFPISSAAKIAAGVICDYLDRGGPIELVRFVLFAEDQYEVFAKAVDDWQASGG
jgi:O-acetyl-ADP-ribose deacetylase (regulator of RNase III)